MSADSSSRAAELASQQVEAIVAAAEAAADEIKAEAQRDVGEQHRRAVEEADETRAEGRREAVRELEAARAKAIHLGENARKEANEMRDEARRAIEGRVAAAEKAADEVLAEARAISGALRRLADLLGSQADGVLRDVQAAHRRMQADLRIGVPSESARSDPVVRRTSERERRPREREREVRAAEGDREPLSHRLPRSDGDRSRGRPRRNAIDDLEVPSWVEPDQS
jgi:hypothetical protein